MLNILDKIFADKQKELLDTKCKVPIAQLKQRIVDQAPARDIFKALKVGNHSKIIAEIKRRTPFKGELRENFNSKEIARDYVENGAAALSILTESNYFGSHIGILEQIKPVASIPLLRKDFICDEYQVYESRAHGADLFLLIATWLEKSQLNDLLSLGKDLGLHALVETHNEYDVEKAFEAKADLIGINNRDLSNGKTDLGISRRLIPLALQEPGKTLVCESGVKGREEIDEFEKMGAHAFLIGETLMKSKDIPKKLSELLNNDESTSKS